MRSYQKIIPAVGVALLALPALAQSMPQAAPRPAVAQETLAGQRGPMAAGSAEREAAAADRGIAVQGPAAWLKEAQDALRRGRLAEASELMERAETRVLSRATPAPLADQPMQGPMLEHSAAARAALVARDRAGAMQQLDLAMAAARDMGASGSDAGALPAQGGSGMRQGLPMPGKVAPGNAGMMGPGMSQDSRTIHPGSAMLRDRGVAATTLSRAEHLTPPALPPQHVLRVQSSQAPANSMGESERAAPGQRMPTPASPNVAPPGPSTMPAPQAGSNAPVQGRSGGSGTTTMPNAAGNGSGITGAPPSGGGSAGGSAN